MLDTETFADFVDLLGPAKAAAWLGGFSDGLKEEFTPHSGAAHDAVRSRAAIHNICARAGLVGFVGLHKCCLRYLEVGSGADDVATAYDHVREAALHAIAEIERQNAQLS